MTQVERRRRRSIAARIDDGETCALTYWQGVIFEWVLRTQAWGQA